MKSNVLTISAREQSRDTGNLAELDHETFSRLTQDGPVLMPGPIMLSQVTFENVIPEYVWTAIALHECGVWGACDNDDTIPNERALINRAAVFSRWFAEDSVEFTIETRFEPGQEQTTVAVSPESILMSEPPPSVVGLGDVLIDVSVSPVPFNRIWFALRQHEKGSPGDTDLFPRRSSFPSGTVAVSWWAQPDNDELFCTPFWLLTHLSEPRLTHVFAGSAGSTH